MGFLLCGRKGERKDPGCCRCDEVPMNSGVRATTSRTAMMMRANDR